jgi:hypothetical protein
MRLHVLIRSLGLAAAATGAALTLAACTYVERVPEPRPTTIVTPPPQQQPTVVAPAPAPPPTVTVRPSY